MKRFIRIAVLAGAASLLAAAPVFAQDLNALNPLGGLGLDLDAFHILTPAPAPAAVEASAPRGHHHRRLHHAAARHAHHAAAHHGAAHRFAAHGGGAHHAAAHHRVRHLAKA